MLTLNEALARAAGFPDCGLRLLDRRERETWLSWQELFERAAKLAGGLRAKGFEHGEIVGLFFPTGREFFTAFFGALLAGAVPAPLYPPVRLGRLPEYQKRTARMLQSAGIQRVLVDRRLRSILGEALSDARCTSYTVGQVAGHEPVVEDADPDSLGLVQFSSGTTVDPKPVALTHRALMAQTTILNSFWPDEPEHRHSGVSWLPLYHDMGLIGCVLTVVERPSTLTLIPPEVFVSRPAVWLRTLSKYRATISPAPNFAFGLCTEKIRDEELQGIDLSSWSVALCGAETVVPSVLQRFAERFEPHGFRQTALTPVYGLSEAALAVTFSDIHAPFSQRSLARNGAPGRELVSAGQPLPGFDVQIRDEADNELSGGQEGRIWVRGPSLMREYLNQPQATAKILRDGWLDTGDLGIVHAGELYVSGRAKDVLIVRGANHAPEEIESLISGLPQVRTGCSAAVGHLVEGADREEVWLFVEGRQSSAGPEGQEIVESCKGLVLAHTGIALDRVVVVEPGTLPRTSSGKIRRQKTLELFLAEELRAPDPVTPGRMVKAVGRSMWARLRSRRPSNAD